MDDPPPCAAGPWLITGVNNFQCLGFRPGPLLHSYATLAQLVEHRASTANVDGSIPLGCSIFALIAQLVERHVANVEVADSRSAGCSILF